MSEWMRSIRGGVDRAAFEAKRLTRAQQAQGQLNALQSEKDKKLHLLGETVWDMYLAGQIQEQRLTSTCIEVRSLESEILDAQNRIEAIKKELPPEPPKCPNCGHEVSDTDDFCSSCGTPVALKSTPQTQGPVMKTCPKCAKQVRPGAVFCGSCGATIS